MLNSLVTLNTFEDPVEQYITSWGSPRRINSSSTSASVIGIEPLDGQRLFISHGLYRIQNTNTNTDVFCWPKLHIIGIIAVHYFTALI